MKSLEICMVNLIMILKVYSENVELLIPPQKSPKFVLDDKFFSVALDTYVVAAHFQNFNMTNKKLINLVKKLNPGYLRIGGNMADRLYFSKNITFSKMDDNIMLPFNDSCIYDEFEDCLQDFPKFTMSGSEWMDLNNFAKNVGTKILFDLNCLIRNDDGSWNSANAEELISFSAQNHFEIDWQLGNEPNAFKHVFNYAVNATQLAKDFSKLRNILNKFVQYKRSLLVGPDVTRPRPKHQQSIKYLKEFLRGIESRDVLDSVAFHQYYLNGRTATIDDFLNPKTFDLLNSQITIINNIVKNSNLKNTPIWLTETSSAYGGGANGLSNTFVGSFLWLDKLGLAAKNGINLVIRQSIFYNSYALIDDDYNPAPDWWLSIFYNKFVGRQVIECVSTELATVRLYCHCGREEPYVTVFGINIGNSTVPIKGNFEISSAYILTAKVTMLSTNVLANGHLLKISENGDIPEIPPKIINRNEPVLFPSYSLMFWLIPYDVEACVTPSVSLL